MNRTPTAVLRRSDGLHTQTELAEALGVTVYVLNWWIRNGRIPAPSRRWGMSKRKYYSTDEVRVIKSRFSEEEPQ